MLFNKVNCFLLPFSFVKSASRKDPFFSFLCRGERGAEALTAISIKVKERYSKVLFPSRILFFLFLAPSYIMLEEDGLRSSLGRPAKLDATNDFFSTLYMLSNGSESSAWNRPNSVLSRREIILLAARPPALTSTWIPGGYSVTHEVTLPGWPIVALPWMH